MAENENEIENYFFGNNDKTIAETDVLLVEDVLTDHTPAVNGSPLVHHEAEREIIENEDELILPIWVSSIAFISHRDANYRTFGYHNHR